MHSPRATDLYSVQEVLYNIGWNVLSTLRLQSIDLPLQEVEEAGCVRAVHLGVVELKRDGQRGRYIEIRWKLLVNWSALLQINILQGIGCFLYID